MAETSQFRVEKGYGLQIQDMEDVRDAKTLDQAMVLATSLGFKTAYIFIHTDERKELENHFHTLNQNRQETDQPQIPFAVHGNHEAEQHLVMFLNKEDFEAYFETIDSTDLIKESIVKINLVPVDTIRGDYERELNWVVGK